MDTTRIDQNKWALIWWIQTGVRCAKLCMMELSSRIGSHCTTAKKWSIKLIKERTGLLWKLSDKKGAGETCFDENLKDQIKNRKQERIYL